MVTSSLIQKAYELTDNLDEPGMLRYDYEEKVNRLLFFNKENKGKNLLIPLRFYLDILDNTNEIFFAFMTQEQKNHLTRDLQVTCLFLLAEKKYELDHQKKEHVKKYDKQLRKCQELLDKLQYEQHCQEQQTKKAPEHGYTSTDHPVAYLGIFSGFCFAQKMVEMTDRASKTIRENMDWVNEKRLYWVWSSSFLKTILGVLPTDFFNTQQAQNIVRYPDPYTGVMSWALYYFRFAINLWLLLKHTIRGPWMSETEKNEPWNERFQTQWQQRKFTLLNDLIWASGNLLCFFWLVGQGAAGTWGDMLTIALLLFDIALTVWHFEEQRIQYNQQMHDYNEAITRLTTQINELSAAEDSTSKRQLIELHMQHAALEKARRQCAREWKYQKLQLATNIAYAVGLMLAFVLLAAPFFPVPALAISAMAISGAVLCFAFSVISSAIQGSIEIHKTKMTVKELKDEREQRIQAFKEQVNLGVDENAKKLMFLEIKKLMIETEYQEKVITYQTMKLLRFIIIDSFIPAVTFVSFVFLPLGTGIGVLAAALALAATTYLLIDALFKPAKEDIKEFNEQEYQTFCEKPECWNSKIAQSPSFFQPEKELPVLSAAETQPSADEIENAPLLEGRSPS